jgi:hypothetical protein
MYGIRDILGREKRPFHKFLAKSSIHKMYVGLKKKGNFGPKKPLL